MTYVAGTATAWRVLLLLLATAGSCLGLPTSAHQPQPHHFWEVLGHDVAGSRQLKASNASAVLAQAYAQQVLKANASGSSWIRSSSSNSSTRKSPLSFRQSSAVSGSSAGDGALEQRAAGKHRLLHSRDLAAPAHQPQPRDFWEVLRQNVAGLRQLKASNASAVLAQAYAQQVLKANASVSSWVRSSSSNSSTRKSPLSLRHSSAVSGGSAGAGALEESAAAAGGHRLLHSSDTAAPGRRSLLSQQDTKGALSATQAGSPPATASKVNGTLTLRIQSKAETSTKASRMDKALDEAYLTATQQKGQAGRGTQAKLPQAPALAPAQQNHGAKPVLHSGGRHLLQLQDAADVVDDNPLLGNKLGLQLTAVQPEAGRHLASSSIMNQEAAKGTGKAPPKTEPKAHNPHNGLREGYLVASGSSSSTSVVVTPAPHQPAPPGRGRRLLRVAVAAAGAAGAAVNIAAAQ